jgi:hypothetical protein
MIDNGDRVRARADTLLPEEEEAGSDDPMAQAAAILEESDEREDDRIDPPGQPVEHRRSEDTVELPVVRDQAAGQTPGHDRPKP